MAETIPDCDACEYTGVGVHERSAGRHLCDFCNLTYAGMVPLSDDYRVLQTIAWSANHLAALIRSQAPPSPTPETETP